MNVLKKVKKEYIYMILIILVLLLIHYFIIPLLIDMNVRKIATKYDNGIYKLKNSKVYVLNLNRNKYTNLLSYNGLGTGNIHVISKKKYSYTILLGFTCVHRDYAGKKSIRFGKCKKETYLFETENKEQVFIVEKTGTYKIELWGAGGGNAHSLGILFDHGGKGAYVSGEILLKKGDVLYFQVGSRGKDGKIIEDRYRLTGFYYPSEGGLPGYNGGGKGFSDPQTDAGGGGGGATDVRILSGKYDDFNVLKSRIMVAGAGGGSSRYYPEQDTIYQRGSGGHGGNINGKDALKLIEKQKQKGYGSTQISGYKFGIGENGDYCMTSANGAGGGAGGYFGSRSGACGIDFFEMPTGAGGGSSYVSGCKGCNAIDKNATTDNLKFTNQPVHYSKKKFANIVMKSGDEKMPSPTGGTMIGNRDDGYARLTLVK